MIRLLRRQDVLAAAVSSYSDGNCRCGDRARNASKFEMGPCYRHTACPVQSPHAPADYQRVPPRNGENDALPHQRLRNSGDEGFVIFMWQRGRVDWEGVSLLHLQHTRHSRQATGKHATHPLHQALCCPGSGCSAVPASRRRALRLVLYIPACWQNSSTLHDASRRACCARRASHNGPVLPTPVRLNALSPR